jgi:hypothetical protein
MYEERLLVSTDNVIGVTTTAVAEINEILIVDDNPLNLFSATTLISKRYGIECDEACNGQVAIDMIDFAHQLNKGY